jgi:hypothetical protein
VRLAAATSIAVAGTTPRGSVAITATAADVRELALVAEATVSRRRLETLTGSTPSWRTGDTPPAAWWGVTRCGMEGEDIESWFGKREVGEEREQVRRVSRREDDRAREEEEGGWVMGTGHCLPLHASPTPTPSQTPHLAIAPCQHIRGGAQLGCDLSKISTSGRRRRCAPHPHHQHEASPSHTGARPGRRKGRRARSVSVLHAVRVAGDVLVT